MQATKYTMLVTVQVLSMDSIPALLRKTADEIKSEVTEGQLRMSDGDEVVWSVVADRVEM